MLLCIIFPCNILHAKTVVFNCLGPMGSAIGQVNSVLKLADGEVMFLWGIQITKGLQSNLLIKNCFSS